MKTNNYQFPLMHQGQEHKDIMYNEAILKIDAMLSFSVVDFMEEPPNTLNAEEKYIITKGDHKNEICYFVHESKKVQYNAPYENMVIYLVKESCFYIFSKKEWQKLNAGLSGSSVSQISYSSAGKFVGIKNKFDLSAQQDFHYLYLDGNAELDFSKIDSSSFTLVIKQNYENIFDIKWPEDILWQDKTPLKITAKTNAIDLFRFYKLPESTHFLAESIQQDYQY
jgi:hypothetical protein